MSLEYIKQDIYLAVDNVVFVVHKGELQVLLVERVFNPSSGSRSLPGGFVGDGETLEQSAYSSLERKTQVKDLYLEQLYTFSEVDRDPRSRVVSTIYMAIGNRANILPIVSEEAPSIKFFSIQNLPELAFDHSQIIEYARKRLQYKLEYTNVAQYFFQNAFSLKELQDVYETVLETSFDVRNFRKKVHSLHMIRETGEYQKNVTHRPAKLYECIDKEIKVFEILGVRENSK